MHFCFEFHLQERLGGEGGEGVHDLGCRCCGVLVLLCSTQMSYPRMRLKIVAAFSPYSAQTWNFSLF